FSSRRRHTRSKRDWSSDVCSSDLRFRRGGLGPRPLRLGFLRNGGLLPRGFLRLLLRRVLAGSPLLGLDVLGFHRLVRLSFGLLGLELLQRALVLPLLFLLALKPV